MPSFVMGAKYPTQNNTFKVFYAHILYHFKQTDCFGFVCFYTTIYRKIMLLIILSSNFVLQSFKLVRILKWDSKVREKF